VPKFYSLRSDPFEEGEDSLSQPTKWTIDHVFIQVPIQGLVAKSLESFKDFPPRAKPPSFGVDQIVERFMPKAG
jgi:arylsulfatase